MPDEPSRGGPRHQAELDIGDHLSGKSSQSHRFTTVVALGAWHSHRSRLITIVIIMNVNIVFAQELLGRPRSLALALARPGSSDGKPCGVAAGLLFHGARRAARVPYLGLSAPVSLPVGTLRLGCSLSSWEAATWARLVAAEAPARRAAPPGTMPSWAPLAWGPMGRCPLPPSQSAPWQVLCRQRHSPRGPAGVLSMRVDHDPSSFGPMLAAFWWDELCSLIWAGGAGVSSARTVVCCGNATACL